jgi:hypothetical protein
MAMLKNHNHLVSGNGPTRYCNRNFRFGTSDSGSIRHTLSLSNMSFQIFITLGGGETVSGTLFLLISEEEKKKGS